MKPPNLLFITSQGSCYEVDSISQQIRWARSREELKDSRWYNLLACESPDVGHAWRFQAQDGPGSRVIRRVTGPITQIEEIHAHRKRHQQSTTEGT